MHDLTPPGELLVLGAGEVRELLEAGALLEALADAFVAVSEGRVTAPARTALALPGGMLLAMPGHREGGPAAVKLVSVVEGNPARGLPSHLAVVCVVDPDTGALLALVDGTEITAARTAGAAALSVRLLADPSARVAAVVGAGVQARAHVRVLAALRPWEEIRVAARRRAEAERLAAEEPDATAASSVEAAVRGAGVVCLATGAAEPVVDAAWIAPGAHVTSVGFHPPGSELPPALLDVARVFVESRAAYDPPPAGCAELAGRDPQAGTELGELLAGRRPGRKSPGEITLFKSMGHVAEDLAAVALALREAQARGRGRRVAM